MSFNPWLMSDQDSLSQSKITRYVYMGLSFAIGLVTFLVYIFIWYLCTRHRRRARQAGTHLPTVNGGLSKSTLAALPTSTYSGAEKDAGASPDCAVCIGPIQTGEKVRQLPKCKHLFHVDCIDMWLYSHSTCPICRCEVAEKDAAKKPETSRVAAIPLVAEPVPSSVPPSVLPPV
ncbi:RING-H2 finger protein ATL2K [Rhynchospora pubera]|uniref:RING-H2 finger protein ATL2K n=1 Tax=Rhynchospora pubera TaxID=906938 RepID=A0AAV8DHI5_9POAL|nr:RING-H2 finger protein ATL2K [Rhynchospora pubera]